MKKLYNISLKELLADEQFSDFKLISGENGLNNIIKNVNVMEVPDILDWVEAGELLVTTLYSIKDNQKALENLIPNLAAKDLAGIAIKVERFLKEIPNFMIKQSNKYDFPIIFIPNHYSLSEVIKNSLDIILNAQKNFLTRTLNIHQILTNEMMGGVDEFANKLGNIIDNPIILVDSGFNILSDNLLESDQSSFIDTIDEEFIYNLKKDKLMEYIEKKVTVNKKELKQIKIPIVYSNYIYGYIITWEYNRSLKKLDINTLNWASTIAAFHILNQKEIFKVNMKYKNEFLYDILKGRLDSKDIIIDRGEKLSWDLKNNFQVILMIALRKV